MWQVVSGISVLGSNCGLQSVGTAA
jgi:hypothetical protein